MMKLLLSLMAVLVAISLASPGRSQDRVAQEGKDPIGESVKKVHALRKERIAVLKDLVDIVDALFKASHASMDDVLAARETLIEAELEVATTPAERVERLQKFVTVFKEYEAWADQRIKAGRGNQASLLKARAKRLAVEIRLEQAKMSVIKAGK